MAWTKERCCRRPRRQCCGRLRKSISAEQTSRCLSRARKRFARPTPRVSSMSCWPARITWAAMSPTSAAGPVSPCRKCCARVCAPVSATRSAKARVCRRRSATARTAMVRVWAPVSPRSHEAVLACVWGRALERAAHCRKTIGVREAASASAPEPASRQGCNSALACAMDGADFPLTKVVLRRARVEAVATVTPASDRVGVSWSPRPAT
jgi:hypothetical protein